MHIDQEYKRLLEEGYIEAGTLVIHVDNIDEITRLELSSEPLMSDNSSTSKAREDKGVVVIDKQGKVKKVSSILLGYNRQQVRLADGSYIVAEELLEAINKAVSSFGQGSVVVDKKGKILNPDELLQLVKETTGMIIIGEKSEKITNQDVRHWSVKGSESVATHDKGLVFLGNEGIQLESGEYISIDDFLKALDEYMVMKPDSKQPLEEITNPKTNSSSEEEIPSTLPIIVRVVRKYKNKFAQVLAVAMATTLALSGIRGEITKKYVPGSSTEGIVHTLSPQDLKYLVEGIESEVQNVSEQGEIPDWSMGEEVQLEDGDTYYETSHETGRVGTIGEGLRQPGPYKISGISIIYQGRIYAANVDLNIENPGISIADFIKNTCNTYNLDINEIEVILHFGTYGENNITGWIDLSTLAQRDNIENDSELASEASTYDGTIKNFEGTTITIDTLNGPVQINVVDSEGNLLPKGTIVRGSDNREYRIGDLELTPRVEKTTVTGIDTEETFQLTWRIEDCSLAAAIGPLIGGALVALKKQKDREEENPRYLSFEDDAMYNVFLKGFIEAKENYRKKGAFGRLFANLFDKKAIDLLTKLTEEQTQELYSEITELPEYDPGDRVDFINSTIIITKRTTGKTIDVTDLVAPLIERIIANNPYEAEGLLEDEAQAEEEKDGIHRK